MLLRCLLLHWHTGALGHNSGKHGRIVGRSKSHVHGVLDDVTLRLLDACIHAGLLRFSRKQADVFQQVLHMAGPWVTQAECISLIHVSVTHTISYGVQTTLATSTYGRTNETNTTWVVRAAW